MYVSGVQPAYLSMIVAAVRGPRTMRFRAYERRGTSFDVDAKRRWIGSSTVTPFGTSTKAPSWRNAVFSAANGSFSYFERRVRCGSNALASSRTASARLMTRTPSGSGRRYESLGAYRPFTKTRSVALRTPNVYGSSRSRTTPSGRPRIAGLKGTFRTGATFVYFHSSCLSVGKPISRKCAIAALRLRRSHSGSTGSKVFSNDSNSVAY